jgi:two-component system alkaline phosphatase synthesis response regulator PhoP
MIATAEARQRRIGKKDEQDIADMDALSILIVSQGLNEGQRLQDELSSLGVTCALASDIHDALVRVSEEPIDIVLVDLDDALPGSPLWKLPKTIKRERDLPVLGLISRSILTLIEGTLGLDDFVLRPCDTEEIVARAQLVVWRRRNLDGLDLIKRGDLVIDLDTCEVTLAGRPVPLTFKEYELLKFLATNPGRVFSREALLDEVWGYDYYGGDRTVDVHIRRLRSKIEDATHTFVETVRNIGYRFKKET